MRTVRRGLAAGLIAQLAVMAALAISVGLGPAGWAAGLAFGVVTSGLLAGGLVRAGQVRPGPADRVTLARATLVGGVAGLTADAFQRTAHPLALVLLASVSLFLDGVDGRVARGTGTVSRLGARFDMEVDAFLILALSICVARQFGVWVLAIGAARYAFVVGGRALPWLRGPAPPRHWCKVVAALQGIVLTVAVADLLPRWATESAVVIALVLLAESFGRQSWWLWRHRSRGREEVRFVPTAPGRSLAGATRG